MQAKSIPDYGVIGMELSQRAWLDIIDTVCTQQVKKKVISL